ncbi:hypothetical protein [uncultured Dokdonia sp.]|uniref:hypothetical protein n=1 Tax=uncultured Dokdonia sp. TaxID=575653 RepID=UPI00262357F8|nr:hypothetical protein [uncultured Dokdonia sp.]
MRAFILIVFVITFISCNNRSSIKETTQDALVINNGYSSIITKPDSIEKNQEKEVELVVLDANQVVEEFELLYKQLLFFKDSQDFKKYGFAINGPYSEWLNNVQDLKDNSKSKLLLSEGIIVVELELLGLEYVSSKGKETTVTRHFNTIFSEVLDKL